MMVHMVCICAMLSCDRMSCDGLDHCRVVNSVNRIDGGGYVVFECSIVCWGVEDVGAGVYVLVKEGMSERVVTVVTRIEAVWDARESIVETGVNRQVKGIKEMESAIGR